MLTFNVTTVGASAGFILTKEAMAHLKVKKGDVLYLTDAPDGGYRLTPFNPEFARQMALRVNRDSKGSETKAGWSRHWLGQ